MFCELGYSKVKIMPALPLTKMYFIIVIEKETVVELGFNCSLSWRRGEDFRLWRPTRKTVPQTVFSPKGEHANKFARSLFKSSPNYYPSIKKERNKSTLFLWRRGEDLNLRYVSVHTLSKRAH